MKLLASIVDEAMSVEAARAEGRSAHQTGFVALYEREHDLQVRRAALLLSDVEAAHDIVHDAFVQIYDRWESVRDPGPYLARAVLNGCRDFGRRAATRRRRTPLLLSRGDEPGDETLWDVLHRLPFQQRAVIVLRFYGGLPEREIAELLGCPSGSVGPWMRRGLAAMREELG